jgi:hypothetical protein
MNDTPQSPVAAAPTIALGKHIRHFHDAAPESYARNLQGFVAYLMDATDLRTRPLPKELGMKRGTFNAWRRDGAHAKRASLEHLTERYALTKTEELDLWTIAAGDLSQPSPANIARQSEAMPPDLSHIPTSAERGALRVTTANQIMARTGFSLNKWRETAALYSDASFFSKPLNITLQNDTKSFHHVGTALGLAQAVCPDQPEAALDLGLRLLGYPHRYTAEEYAHMATSGAIPLHEMIVAAREQHFLTQIEAPERLGMPQTTYARWERQPTALTDTEYAHALVTTLFDAPYQSPAYETLMRVVMGKHHAPYTADVALKVPPLPPAPACPDRVIACPAEMLSTQAARPTRTAREWLVEWTKHRPREGFYEQLSQDLCTAATGGRTLAADSPFAALFSPQRVADWFRDDDRGTTPGLMEQSVLISLLKPDAQSKDAFTAACREVNAQGSGKA